MKTISQILPLAALAALVFAGCSKTDRNQTSTTADTMVKNTFQDTKNAMGNAWDDVKSYSFDKRDDFTKSAKALSARLDSQLSEVRANYSEAKASASRKAAMAELKDAEADYRTKLDAVGHATSATWDSAKQNTIAAWDRLQAAYYKARAD